MKTMTSRNKCTKISRIGETDRDFWTAVMKAMKKTQPQQAALREEVDVCIIEMI